MKQNSNLCENCVSKFKVSSDENIELIKKIAKLEVDYKSVAEENENLRIGLNEILEKLRDYEGKCWGLGQGSIREPRDFFKKIV